MKIITERILILCLISLSFYACSQDAKSVAKERKKKQKEKEQKFSVQKTDAEWKKVLSPEAYYVLRKKGTEKPYENKYFEFDEKGIYKCAGCGAKLFSSNTKFACPTGWPSYWEPIESEAVVTQIDRSHGMVRTEVMCAGCGGHLGHVFRDGPKPTGLRYCINSVSLEFEKSEE